MATKIVGGYTGKVLRVDLTHEKISEESLDEATLRKYVGGTGIGARYLYNEVPAGVEWSDEANRMMFFSGPLSGTKVNGSGNFTIVTKGPMTNLAVATQANGYFGAYLKFSGFDGVVLQGKARDWKYLYIHDGTAELRDARSLMGKNTWETEDAVKSGLNNQCSVFSIGPAGENLVRFAAIVGDRGHVAGHNGVGAVMGAKKLKAIVAEKGNFKIPMADPDKAAAAASALIEDATKKDPNMSKWGTGHGYPMLYKTGQLPVRNYTTNLFPAADKFSGEYMRTNFKVTPTTCWACRTAHCRLIEITEGPYAGFSGEEPEYEGSAAMSSVIGQEDPAATIVLCNTIDRLGMDINETGYLIGWLMECSEKGYLKKNDLDGLELKWGDVKATLEILNKIANRQGSGNLWAEGVKRSAEKVGGEALNCAVYTLKGASPRGHDHRGRWNEFIDTCFSNTSTVECGPGMPFPDVLGLPPLKDRFNSMEVSTMSAKTDGIRQLQDSLGICFFCVQDFHLLLDNLNAITGWNYDIEEAMKTGRRIINLLRVFNFRHGLVKENEAPSLRYGSIPVDGPNQGKNIMLGWNEMRANYYRQMGWDTETGKPLPETLEALDLGYAIPALKG
jgi:aldehyde:ferredoxin oxidoreductase